MLRSTLSLMHRIAHIIWHRLTGLMPGELDANEVLWLISPHQQSPLLARRRAMVIVNRVRLFAFLFAVLTPLWSIVDYVVFPFPLWFFLAGMRLVAAAAFATLVICYKPSGNLLNAYRAMALLFAIPTVFYVVSHQVLTSFELTGMSAAIGAGYAFLPFVLLAGLSIFPLTFLENLAFVAPMLLAQLLAQILSWGQLNWPSFAGAFWLMALIAGVANLAGMSQLAFMVALVRQAIRDPLTGVHSRRSAEEILELYGGVANRADAPLAVAFIDLDHFKSINDRHGHDEGDKALRRAAKAISESMRRGDILTRWGGEEFLLIMPNTRLTEARAALERLTGQGLGRRPDGTLLTASVGIAERVDDQTSHWEELIEIADRRMYTAKHAGRNRIVIGDAVDGATDGAGSAPQPA